MKGFICCGMVFTASSGHELLSVLQVNRVLFGNDDEACALVTAIARMPHLRHLSSDFAFPLEPTIAVLSKLTQLTEIWLGIRCYLEHAAALCSALSANVLPDLSRLRFFAR